MLSVRESRVNYDLTRRKNPDLYKAQTEHEFNLENRRDMRDKRGMVPNESPTRGSYAEERLAQLKREREKYNVNHLGFYNGGVPQKNKGARRGKALGNTGEFHSP